MRVLDELGETLAKRKCWPSAASLAEVETAALAGAPEGTRLEVPLLRFQLKGPADIAYYSAVPSDAVLKFMNRTHRVLIAVTGGRAGRSFSGMPVVELTTIGRKSGQARSCMLTSPYQEGERTYIVASRGGDDHDPAWFLNLTENPEVTVSIQGGSAQKMHAEVSDPDERARVWPLLTAKHTNYANYQKKTHRQIPLVILTPAEV